MAAVSEQETLSFQDLVDGGQTEKKVVQREESCTSCSPVETEDAEEAEERISQLIRGVSDQQLCAEEEHILKVLCSELQAKSKTLRMNTEKCAKRNRKYQRMSNSKNKERIILIDTVLNGLETLKPKSQKTKMAWQDFGEELLAYLVADAEWTQHSGRGSHVRFAPLRTGQHGVNSIEVFTKAAKPHRIIPHGKPSKKNIDDVEGLPNDSVLRDHIQSLATLALCHSALTLDQPLAEKVAILLEQCADLTHGGELFLLETAVRLRLLDLRLRPPSSWTQIGNALVKIGRMRSALCAHTTALQLKRNNCKSRKSNELPTLFNLGLVQRLLGCREESKACYLEALSIARDLNSDVALGIALHESAVLADDAKEAISAYDQALHARKKAHGERHLAVAETLLCLGSRKLDVEDHDGALVALTKALHIRRTASTQQDCASCVEQLGYLGAKLKQYDIATQCFDDALRIRVMIHGCGHPAVASLALASADIYALQIHDFAKAAKRYQNAYQAYSRLPNQGGARHASLLASTAFFAAFYSALNLFSF